MKITFSNNLYRTVQIDSYAGKRDSIYIILNGNESEKEMMRKNVHMRVYAFYECMLRCFLKSNFYNRHIVCQKPDIVNIDC